MAEPVGAVRRVVSVVGARPQFVKAAAVCRAVARHNLLDSPVRIEERMVHTGQHYDPQLSAVFFAELGIPAPAENLGVGSGPHGQQTGRMLELLERLLLAEPPDWVLVYGDTNSTLAAALAAAKLNLPVVHVEAGLRSGNLRMAEEQNRIVADQLATLLLCPTPVAVANLAREGRVQGVELIGDVMYDSLLYHTAGADAGTAATVLARLGLPPRGYYLATVHRAENTDDPARLASLFAGLARLPYPVLLPLHPRTRARLDAAGLTVADPVRLLPPVSYLEMLPLLQGARIVLTDSGGVQKEAYWLGVPCVTLREETEWRELVEAGCNRVVGVAGERIHDAVAGFERQDARLPADRPRDLYGDGQSARRVVELLASYPLPGRTA
ncbi:MAG: UDP-N-acetylglucosamine 2-epimerase (non-hydrolyzing) [Myxococcota bacterium]|nr:UDP-N-acetylglucosamine 2-epimerase (non-hydrolyzing) [Myxococcota bacterium]